MVITFCWPGEQELMPTWCQPTCCFSGDKRMPGCKSVLLWHRRTVVSKDRYIRVKLSQSSQKQPTAHTSRQFQEQELLLPPTSYLFSQLLLLSPLYVLIHPAQCHYFLFAYVYFLPLYRYIWILPHSKKRTWYSLTTARLILHHSMWSYVISLLESRWLPID